MASTIEIKRKAKAKFVSCAPKGSELNLSYDRDVDVLYVNFTRSKPQKADFGRMKGDYILRYRGSDLVGVTVLNTKQHCIGGFKDFRL